MLSMRAFVFELRYTPVPQPARRGIPWIFSIAMMTLFSSVIYFKVLPDSHHEHSSLVP